MTLSLKGFHWLKRPSGRLVYLFALTLGALYPLGLAPLSWWPLLGLSVFGLVWILLNAQPKDYGKITYCYGLGFFAVGASWVHVSIHQFGNAPLWLSIALTAIFVLFLALFKALIGWMLKFCERFTAQPVVAFPLLWLVADFVQGAFLTGFPWLYLGYGLVDTPFASWLPIAGVQGSGFFAVALMTCIAITFRYMMHRQANHREVMQQGASAAGKRLLLSANLAVFAIVGFTTLFLHFKDSQPLRSQQVSIGIVQPNIPQAEKWLPSRLPDYLSQYEQMTQPLWGADFIFWPEAAVPALQHRVQNWLDHWETKAQSSGSELILGIPRYDVAQERIYASLISLGTRNYSYDKHHLVPFGEFVPFEGVLRGLIEFFNLPMSRMAPGSSVQPGFTYPKLNFLPAICYEIAYLDRFLNAKKNDNNQPVNVILTVSNDAWFGRSWGPHQHYQIARARALELAMPLIRSTNNGISAVIDAKGQVLMQLPHYQKAALTQSFEFVEYDSVFLNYRYWVLILLIGFAQGLLIWYERKLNKNA